jgi:hypothetical protein
MLGEMASIALKSGLLLAIHHHNNNHKP